MIPKKIHYIWLGHAPLPATVVRCIRSWQQHLPDFDIVLWNEANLNIDAPAFHRAYKEKRWAFCSDLARLQVLYDEGGIYLDTDMEVIKNLTSLLDTDLFMGREDAIHVSGGILGATPHNPFIRDARNAVLTSLAKGDTPIPKLLTRTLHEKESSYHFKICIYPPEYFYPYNPFVSPTKHLMFSDITANTFTIHHWGQSWVAPLLSRLYSKIRHLLKMKWYQFLEERWRKKR